MFWLVCCWKWLLYLSFFSLHQIYNMFCCVFYPLLIVTISIITSSHSLLHYLNINSLLAQNKNKKRKAKNNSSSQTLYRLQIPQPNQHPSASVSKSQRLQVAYRLTLGRLSQHYTATLTTTVCSLLMLRLTG